MRTNFFVPTFISVLLSGALAAPAMSQGTGPVAFDATESALTGTVACNGCSSTPIASVDASTTDVTGGNNVAGSNQSATACGLPLYSIASANDSTSAQDTSSQDDGNGNGTLQTVSLLGGVVTYQNKTEAEACDEASVAGQAVTAGCQAVATIHNLMFAGQHITGTFTSPATFQAIDVNVRIPGYCTGRPCSQAA